MFGGYRSWVAVTPDAPLPSSPPEQKLSFFRSSWGPHGQQRGNDLTRGPHWHPRPGLRRQPVWTCPATRCRPRHVPAAGPHPGTLQSPGCWGGERASAEWAQVRKPPASSCPPPQSGHQNPCSSQCPSQSGRPGWPACSIPVGTHSVGAGMGYWAFSSSPQGCVLRQGGRN